MNGYLVDTDWAIDYLAGEPQVAAVLQALPPARLFISVISLAELYEGAHGAREPSQALESLANFVSGTTVLDVSRDIARLFGERRAQFRRAGRLIDNFDLLIAATCLQHDLRLLTNNISHFERIERLELGLAAE